MKVTVKLDDISPLIEYRGTWEAGSAKGDGDALKYSDEGTFTLTTSNDAAASIEWHGTQITVYGAKRFNHKEYSVTLDNGATQVLDGYSENGVFQTPLYQSPLMVNGPHTLVVQDASSDPNQPYFDIDFLVIDGDIPGNQSANIEDDDPAWTWAPANAWSNDPTQFPEYSGTTGHSTRAPSATATLHFEGNALDLYGLICEQCGGYWVSIDDKPPVPLTAYNAQWSKPKSLLYMARGLEDTQHTLVVTNLGQGGSGLSLDYVVAYGNQPRGFIASNTTETSQTSSLGGQRTTSKGPANLVLILAIVIPLIMILIALLVIWLLRRARVWPFNGPRANDELEAGRHLTASSPYPGAGNAHGLNLDMPVPNVIPPMLSMPSAPASTYGSEVQGPQHPFAWSVQEGIPGSSGRSTEPYDGMGLPSYGDTFYNMPQQPVVTSRNEKGRF